MAAGTPENPGLTNWILIVVMGFIWGSVFLAVRLALDGFGPFSVAAIRVGVGALALVIIGAAMGQGLDKVSGAKGWVFATIIGAGYVALPLTLVAWGQQFVPSAFAGVAMGAVPLMILPLVYLFSPDEGIGPRRIIGVLLGFVGVVILIGPDVMQTTGRASESLGRLACFGAVLCYGIGSVVTRRAPKMPPVAFATAGLVVASVIMVPVALIQEGIPQNWPLTPSLAALYAALFPTALGAVLRVRIITTAGSLFMSLVSYQIPVWSVILGILVLDEALSPRLFIALGVILAGIGLSQSRSLAGMFRR